MCRHGSWAPTSTAWSAADLLLYFAAPACALLVFLVRQLPTGPVLHLTQWPSLASLAFQILVAACTKRTSAVLDGQEIPNIEVVLAKPTASSLSRLANFRALVGHHALPAQEVPLMYPIVESFRLCIQAMLMPQFPLHILGSVLARNRTEVHTQLSPQDELVYRCQVGTKLRVTAKGDTEADLISTATRQSDGKEVWKSTLTLIVLGKYRNKRGAGESAAPPAAASSVEREQLDVWRLSGAVGRQYGALNGDLNPIHLHAATSRLFGFRRPIAHALFLVAKAEASLRNNSLVKPVYPCILETEFKRPTLLPAKLAIVRSKVPLSAELQFAVVTADAPPKDVIVGKLLQETGQ